MRFADGRPVPNLGGPGGAEDAEDSAQKAINYRTEPLWKRMNYAPETPWEKTRNFDFTNVLTNAQVGGDPQTPVFTARRTTSQVQDSECQRTRAQQRVQSPRPLLAGGTVCQPIQDDWQQSSVRVQASMWIGPSSHYE